MINILIADDSNTEAAILRHIFEAEPNLSVVGHARNGAEAVRLVPLLKPDIITMDIKMPVMDGILATKEIMEKFPTPIVIISSNLNDGPLGCTFQALEAGALSVLKKPLNITSSTFEHDKRRMLNAIFAMAEIKLLKQRAPIKREDNRTQSSTVIPKKLPSQSAHYELIAIGASVGGTTALNAIISKLPLNFPLPIVVVQHIMPGFIRGFANWLNNNTPLTVKEIANNEILKKSHVYFAPDNFHLEIHRINHHLTARLVKSTSISGFCPSITVLLKSVAESCGRRGIGVLLTGMGNDGAEGLLALKNAQGHTIIQDKESSIVFGLAGVAQSMGAVDVVVPLEQIANYLIKVAST